MFIGFSVHLDGGKISSITPMAPALVLLATDRHQIGLDFGRCDLQHAVRLVELIVDDAKTKKKCANDENDAPAKTRPLSIWI